MTKIRMAQYGTQHGHAAGKLLAMNANQNVEVTGIFEPNVERRNQLQNSDGAFANLHWYESKHEMLDDPKILAIASEGWNAESLDQTEEIVNAGKHVWYDKPAGENWEQWQTIVSAAESQGIQIQMGYMLRYHSAFKRIVDWAKSGFLGQVFSVRAHMSTYLSPEAQFVIKQHMGGIFYDLGGHMLDQVVWLLGRPDRVTSFLRSDSDLVTGFSDNTLAVFEFPSAMAFIDIAAMETRPMARRFEIYGDQGSAIIAEPFEPGERIRLCLQEAKEGYTVGEQLVTTTGESRDQLYRLELEAFLATIMGKQEPDRPLSHELLVQETLLRATGVISD
ncbi:MAG: Gfo/Idh/MocA family oxidoreductase [Candidatus Poribacteria bacterium]